MQPCAKCCESFSEKTSHVSSDFDSMMNPMEERQKSSWLSPLLDYPSAYASPNPPTDLEEYLDASDVQPPRYEDTFAMSDSTPSIPSKDNSRSPLERSRKGSRLSGIPEEDSGVGSENGDPLGRSRLKLPPPPPRPAVQQGDPWNKPTRNPWSPPQSRTRPAPTEEKRTSAGVPLLEAPLQTSVEEEEPSQLSDSLLCGRSKAVRCLRQRKANDALIL
ncbi:hypothetical protein COOONC_13648 [Cooperia oncophora]